jgi:hypothetical protein
MTRTRLLVSGFLCLVNVGCPAPYVPLSAVASASLACTDASDMPVAPMNEIRLAFLYTEAAAAATLNIEDAIRHAVQEANAVLAQSGIEFHLALAQMAPLNGSLVNEDEFLQHVVDMINQVAPLHDALPYGDRHHADIVVLLTNGGAGAAIPMFDPGSQYKDSAFVSVGYSVMESNLTLLHEVAHILGSNHHRDETAPDKLPSYRYAFPKRCPSCGWRTIMATPDEAMPDGASTVRIPYFSNPDILYYDPAIPGDPGTPLGVPASAVEPEDNRKALMNIAPIVSSFRTTPVWFASSQAKTAWFEKRVADESMSDVRFADFDGDGTTDAFAIGTDGSWLISRSASTPWEPLRGVDPLSVPLEKLRFADFNGDGSADAFYVDPSGKWRQSHGATGAWQVLNANSGIAGFDVTDLLFGEFDGLPGADVFRSDASTGTWYYSAAGQSTWISLGLAAIDKKFATNELRVGDFDGNGYSDIFRSDVSAQKWRYSPGGTSPWIVLLADPEAAVSVDKLLFGDFDGDDHTDVLKTTGTAWGISWKGSVTPELVKLSCVTVEKMALGDFDGDGKVDVIRAGIRP